VLFLDEPTSGLDSSTAFDVCQNLRNIAIQQGLTVAAVIHSPSPTTFKQFDDFILLGKGGRIVYIGPRDQALDYFKRIGFTCPADESPSDFFMDVVSGFVASEYDTEFKPTDLADYWQNRHLHIFAHKRRMTPEQAEYFKKQRIQSDNEEQKFLPPPKVKDYYAFTDYIASGLAAIIQNVSGYLKGLFLEFFEFLKIVAFMVVCKPDPVRETAPAYMKAWFLMRRAAHQVYRTPQATLVDLGLNFTAGLFISIAVQEFGFVGGQPPEVCSFVPSNLQYLCVQPTDRLRYIMINK
jgi:hypothetical protein